jgi:hypothetical protein
MKLICGRANSVVEDQTAKISRSWSNRLRDLSQIQNKSSQRKGVREMSIDPATLPVDLRQLRERAEKKEQADLQAGKKDDKEENARLLHRPGEIRTIQAADETAALRHPGTGEGDLKCGAK